MLTLVICDPAPIHGRWLRATIGRDPEIRIVGATTEYVETVAAVERERPAVTLLSGAIADNLLERPGSRRLTDLTNRSSVAVSLADPIPDQAVANALACGVRSVIVGPTSPQEITAALLAAESRQLFLSPSLLSRHSAALIRILSQNEKICASPNLTARESEVLRLLANGMSNNEIADDLYVSVSTVRSHVLRVMRKTGARNRAQAVSHAFMSGRLRERGPEIDTQARARERDTRSASA